MTRRLDANKEHGMCALPLRLATVNDAEALSRLGRRTFVETFVEHFQIPYPADDLASFLDESFAVSLIRQRLEQDPREPCWVAEVDHELVAFARAGGCALPHPAASSLHAELKALYVARSMQGRGLGRALMETALSWMVDQGEGPLWVGVWSGNHKAQRLYGHYGFAKAGEYEYPVGRFRDLEYILRRAR
jgi:diamine N-acetyltransferase